MMQLETQRLLLREIRPSDFDDLLRMNSDPDIMKYVGDGSVRNDEEMLQEFNMLMSNYARKTGLGILAAELKNSHVFVGAIGLVYYENTTEIEIGYRFLKEHWNKGYATEASLALLQYGFETLGLQKIVASAFVDNSGSTRVMEKIGMRYIDNRLHYGRMQAYYEIERKDFIAGGSF